MRKVGRGSIESVQWIRQRHEADCWIAACAMAVGASYEEAEKAFGSGEDYSVGLLGEKGDPVERRLSRLFMFVQAWNFFTMHGCYALTIPEINPALRRGRRYLLSATTPEPERPWMAHTLVVDERGKVFDPDPSYDSTNPRFSIENYQDLAGWEIVRWESV